MSVEAQINVTLTDEQRLKIANRTAAAILGDRTTFVERAVRAQTAGLESKLDAAVKRGDESRAAQLSSDLVIRKSIISSEVADAMELFTEPDHEWGHTSHNNGPTWTRSLGVNRDPGVDGLGWDSMMIHLFAYLCDQTKRKRMESLGLFSREAPDRDAFDSAQDLLHDNLNSHMTHGFDRLVVVRDSSGHRKKYCLRGGYLVLGFRHAKTTGRVNDGYSIATYMVGKPQKLSRYMDRCIAENIAGHDRATLDRLTGPSKVIVQHDYS